MGKFALDLKSQLMTPRPKSHEFSGLISRDQWTNTMKFQENLQELDV